MAMLPHVPSEPRDVLRAAASLRDHGQNVLQRLLDLRDEALGEGLVLVPADEAAGENEATASGDAVGVPFRFLPTGRLKNGERVAGGPDRPSAASGSRGQPLAARVPLPLADAM